MMMSRYKVGDLVNVTERRIAGCNLWQNVTRKCRVIQVCERFIAVRGPHFVECVWTDNDEMNNIVIRRVSG